MSAKFLIFIDTNIFLDFYRVRGRESDLSILKHIDDNLDRFIVTSQVEMEFKKNRQRVIADSRDLIKPPDFGGLLQLPAFLVASKQSKALERAKNQIRDYSTTLKKRITQLLKNPTTHDPVYRTTQRLFRTNSSYNLNRQKTIRNQIRHLARKRFVLGYPPRKREDITIGDAVNWEWIIHCAKESGEHVVIVTRDADYGVNLGDGPIMNDWLLHEFRERVSKKRKLLLTDRLSTALKLASITVTEQEEKAENELLKQRQVIVSGPLSLNPPFVQGFRNVVAHGRAFDPNSTNAIFLPAGEVSYQFLSPGQVEFVPSGQVVVNYDLEVAKAFESAKLAKAKAKDNE